MDKNVDKKKVLRAVISKIEEEGNPSKIKAKDLNEYETPEKIIFKGKDEGFVPDIIAYYEKETNLYEVEMNSNENPVHKWSLLSLYAKNKKGHLFLIVPDYKKEEVKEELVNNGFNVGLIYFSTE